MTGSREPQFNTAFTLDEIRALMAAALFTQERMALKPASLDAAWDKLEALLAEHEPLTE